MLAKLLDKKTHNRKDFDCGVPALNTYLQQTARQHYSIELSATYVLTDEHDSSVILGYYTLSTYSIRWVDLPEHLRSRYPQNGISAALIGRLAIDKNHQNKGLGRELLIDAIEAALNSTAPHSLIVVDAKNQQVRDFYCSVGFEEISSGSNKLYMTAKYAREML